MQIYRNIDKVKSSRSAITIGFFDGVHIGHRKILQILKEQAHQDQSQSMVVTFWPHPRLVLNHEMNEVKLLMSLDEKIDILSQMGIDSLLIMDFTRELAQVRAYNFLEDNLVKKLKASSIVVGYNHAFGYRGKGNYNLIEAHQNTFGYQAVRVDPIEVGSTQVSSTQIRNALTQGDLKLANAMLGQPYFITGTIEGGEQIGRAIGYPTANIKTDEPHKLIPLIGVYAVWVEYKGIRYPSMLNIGIRPTVGDKLNLTVEAHIIGFNQDIYNEQITVHFVERIRDEIKFPSLDALKAELALDRERTINILQPK